MKIKQLVVASLSGLMLAGVAFGGNELNPQFLKWRKMKAAGMLPQQKRAAAERQAQDASATIALTPAARASLVGDDAGNGLAPDAADLSYLADCNVPPSWKPVNGYPKSFDLRTSGNVTAARRQGNFETCWAFASMGSLESSILVQKPANKNYTAADVDFSERHMVDNHGFDLTPQHGGSMLMAMAYLTRWGGPVMENAFPYPSADATEWSSLGGADTQPLLHVQHVRWLPGKTKYLENDLIKDSVLSLGGVYVTYFDNASFYNAGKAAYYCNITKEVNHGVLIIGWNDDYPASNFASASGAVPPGPGAYLVKNNRGEDWGDNGCFWVSYYDQNFAVSAMAVFNGFESKANYSTIYQHDPLGYTGKSHAGNSRNGKAWMANVFTAPAKDTVTAVGFYTLTPDTSYRIRVYSELTGSDPSTGTLRESNTQNGTAEYAGYITVPLDKAVSVAEGERFAVCVELYSKGFSKPLACEAPVDGYSVRANARKGESFYSSNGNKWYDLQDNMQGANFCVKAYGIGDRDPDEVKMGLKPVELQVTGPAVVAAGATATFSLAVVLEDMSLWGDPTAEYEILSGAEALSARRVSENSVLLTVREDITEDTPVSVRFSATDDATEITVTKDISFTVTRSVPAAPEGLITTAGEVDAGVRLAWDAVANASGYTVYRSTSADVRNAVFLANAEINRYTDTSAVPGIDYTYFVKALNSSGASAFSEGGTGWRKLAAPADFIATDGDYDYVQLSWSAVEGASFYKVFRATDMDAVGNPVDPVELTGWIEGQSYRDTPPEKGVRYFYWVKSALSWTGYRPSDYSIFDPGSRKAPVVLSGVQIDGPATVPAGETASYTLAAMFSDGSRAENVSNAVWNCSLGGDAVTGDRFSFTALVDGCKVSSNTLVSVTAQWAHSTEDGTVTKSDTKYIVIAPVIPSKPNAPKISASGTDGISIVWDSVEAAYSYRLYRGETAESAQLLQTTAALSYLDVTVIPGAAVRYWIEAENAAGVSPRSEASVAAMRRFTPPVYVSASNGTSTEDVTVSWRAVTGAKFYRVARADSPDGVKRDMSGWIAERTFADTTAEPGVTYWYFVQAAYDAEGGSASEWSSATIGKVSPAQTLAFIEIDGPSSIQYDSSGSFVCTATYANGVQKRVNPTWSFKAPNELVSVNAAGIVTAGHVKNEDLHLELQASFTDNGVTKTDSFAVTVIAWKAVTPQVFVSNVVVRARWPWNGIVDISYDLYSVPATAHAVVTVVGLDHDLNQTLQAVTLTGDGADHPAAGGAPHKDCRVVWNLGADYTNFHASAFSVSLDAAPYAVAAPADFRASDGTSTNAVELAWETAFGAVHYEIFRSLTNNRDDAELLASVTNATEFADVTAEHGETYYYWIRTVAGEFEEDISEESGPVAGKRATPPYSAPAVNLQNGLVAYYPFDGSRDDASGNRNHMHLSLRDAPAQVADRNGREGAAYRFAGKTQFETTTNRYRIVKLSGEFTFSCWVRTDKPTPLKGEQMLGINTGCNFLVHPSNAEFMEGEAGANVGYGIAVGSNGVNLFEHCDSFLPATLRYAANLGGGWHHVAFTVKDNGAPVLYVDGAYAKTGIDTGKLKHLFVGDNFGGEMYGNYTGDADDVCYYDRALEPEEIAALFEAGSPLVADRPVSVKPEIDVAYADGAATVTISCEEVGAGDNQPTVYYTISRADGGDTVDAREYTVPFTVEGDATVTAWSAKEGYYDSPRVKVRVKADWRETVIGTIGDGNGKIEWSTSGDGDWVFDPNESADTRNGSMRSGRIVANGNSVLTATFTGAGTFAFDWKVSSESQFDFLTLTVDGETPHRISGEMDWSEMVLEFTNDVQHVVSWTYAKDGNVSRGSDCGWVDYITWAPAGTMVDAPQATITPLGAGVSNVVTIACANTPGATIEYKLDLFGVEGEWKTYAEPLVVEGDGIIHMRAKKQGYIDSFVSSQKIRRLWIVRANEALLMDPVTRRNVRLEGDYFEYGIDEEYWWDQDRSVVSDGTCASMTNPDLMDGEYASMFARFSGMGTFFFDRKVDSEAGWDVLTYYAGEDGMDYSYADAISGDRDWERVKLVFRTAGEHVIEWEYDKDGTGSNGRDRGWVDYLQWVPARFAPAVPDPRTGYVFGGWTTNENGAVVYEPGIMLDAMDKNETFIPVWTPISYRVAYDAERVVGDGRLEQTFVYDTPQSLVSSTNFLFARGYTFSGWTTNEQNTVDFADEATVMNLAATADAVVTLRPVFAVNGYTVRFYDGSQKVADDIAAKYGEAFALPALDSTSNRRFDGWSAAPGGAVAYAGGASVKDLTDVDGGTVTLYACWTEIVIPYAEALDLIPVETAPHFESSGDAEWTVQSDVVHYGDSAVQSGAIEANGSTTLSTKLIYGERKRLSFWWKVSSEQNWDKFRFYVNGKEMAAISGLDGDWKTNSVVLAAGTNLVSWTYTKDGTGDRGEDCGWLDQLTIETEPDPAPDPEPDPGPGPGDDPEPDPEDEPVFKVIQYTISQRPYTIDDALAATNTPSIWLDDPVTATYTQINFGDNVKLAQNFPNGMVSFPGNVSEGRKATYYVCQITGKVRVTEAGEWTLACGSDDGFRCILTDEDGKAYSFEYFRDRSYDTTIKTFNFAKAGVYDLYLIYFEYGDASVLDLSCAKGKYSRFNKSKFKLLGTPESGIPLVGKEVPQPQEHDKVQLWENGPYWATTNIGAEKPEDYGYYFWWGDTVGYKRENNAWVASDGSTTNFSFTTSNTPTYGKVIATLQREGWITAEGVLAPEHDAAHIHWGGDWRMPTHQEIKSLNNKCDWTWTTMNGVAGYVVRGRGDYASNSIFLPCAGQGAVTLLDAAGSTSFYWSSVPYSVNHYNYSWSIYFYSSSHQTMIDERRTNGRPVRPVQGFTNVITKVVTITFDANGGMVSPATKSCTANSQYGTLPTPTRSGYTFEGWFTASTGGTRVTDSSVVPDSATTLYAQWSPVQSDPPVVQQHGLYMVIDLSGGKSAANYPVSHLNSVPAGGWTDEYKTTKLVMRRIEPGTFTMGDYTLSNMVQVTLSKPYYMGVFEVSQKQYELVMGQNPSYAKGAALPVECVSWRTIRGSNKWPVDKTAAASSFVGLIQSKTGLNLDLPTEAQWEYACRAGTSTRYYWGDSMNGSYAWYWDNAGAKDPLHTVGLLKPNAWGLYDMIGNAFEWCLDWYQDKLPGGTDPDGFTSGKGRVFRGGSGTNFAYTCSSAYRSYDSMSYGFGNYGFRLACPAPVNAVARDKVQLWENGPYWATTNIGAEKPEDSGYYFWCGDTVGYKRENDEWVATDGSTTNFSFTSSNVPTDGKSISTLQSEGWIISDGVLAPEHDAAQVQWGGGWRMPTYQELYDLCYDKCDWTWTTQNGVKGYIVHGRGEYASNSIFLPCAGYGYGTSLNDSGSLGLYWSSVPGSDSYILSWGLNFDSSGHYTGGNGRYFGFSVRPVQGFTK